MRSGADGSRRFSRSSGEHTAAPLRGPGYLGTCFSQLLDAFESGDIAAIEGQVHPDCIWRFPGRKGALAGEHRGRDAVFGFFGQVMTLTDGTFGMEVTDVVAGVDRAVVLFSGYGSRPDGRTLDNATSLVIRLDSGQAIEVDEFVWDLEAVEEFWS